MSGPYSCRCGWTGEPDYYGGTAFSMCPECGRALSVKAVHRNDSPVDTLDSLAAEVAAWAIPQFPKATPESWVAHLRKEVEKELTLDPCDPEEIADCVMLLFGLAGKIGLDLKAAIRSKLDINKGRTWGEPDEQGVVEHIRTPPEPPAEEEVEGE